MKCIILNLFSNSTNHSQCELVMSEMWPDFESATKLENWKVFPSCWPNGQVYCEMFCFNHFDVNCLLKVYRTLVSKTYQIGTDFIVQNVWKRKKSMRAIGLETFFQTLVVLLTTFPREFLNEI